ncbi:hypothetical protein GCM10008023_06060 [Sphingomonas glacialis]|uniref:Uncharacterized protein n=1 Tax=Sphingomonas glacialis TaxID=658225 RepID=A0ABQ3LA80_9SPHN|nr:hypothetical protein [Sphingomonas glacialis]GHH09412.1 hypothetical protein GCM10008023_06060 [Sphingomonas glacialis]
MASGVSIILPSAGFTPTFAQEEVTLLHATGFVDRGLVALHMLAESSGAAFLDAKGGIAGNLDSIINSNNAFARLSGGGVSLSGAQFISFPTYEAHAPWTLFTAGAIIGDVGSEFEKITGFIGHRTSYGTAPKGAYCYGRGVESWTSPASAQYFLHRADGTDAQLSAPSVPPAGNRRVIALSYDGSSTLTSAFYNVSGVAEVTGPLSATPAQLFTSSGTTNSMLQPIIGGLNDVFDGAIQQFEFFARYNRALTDFSATEIQIQVAAASQLGGARGRAWS